ncbi:unnamed protein product [Clonostachys rhizophaga]|uniref:Uncharacterized protein n=1 Tax=Clonostachys rhizophaga TaxID=160324 RepID=A0A9N9VQN0_9HYPO|nr:unnamed protein product [Clonostachys rhizophaga]
MVIPTKPPANHFVAAMRKIYNPIGFSHWYNFFFFVLFTSPLTAFCALSMRKIDVDNSVCGKGGSAPGDCYYYSAGLPRIGMYMHLAGVLPASVLACFQFVPVIRHKFILFHRISGYIVLISSAIGAVGGLLIARNAFGGGLDVQSASGAIFILFFGALIMAYINIKRLQIDQHRAWMLRAWFCGGTILMARLLDYLVADIISQIGGYHSARPCGWLKFTIGDADRLLRLYPDCSTWLNGKNPDQMAVVRADSRNPTSAAEAVVAHHLPFGMSIWLGLFISGVVIEIYLHLTPKEAERLRMVSYQRQLAAGVRHPGSTGLTSDRLGDADQWYPRNIEQCAMSGDGNSNKEQPTASASAST